MHKRSPSKQWRKFNSKYRLGGSVNSKGKVMYPPVNFDPQTGESNLKLSLMPEKGVLVTWSVIKVGPKGYEEYTPYAVGIIEFENGERTTGQIVDVDFATLEKGQTLYPTFRKFFEDGEDGVIQYGLKWTK